MDRIYLDYNATTPTAPSVSEAMQPFLTEHFGNPSSAHILGRAAHQAVEEARRRVAGLLAAAPEEIIFTSGGTESNNLALKGVLLNEKNWAKKGHLIISAIEHPATSAPAEFLKRIGFDVSICRCDRRGVVSPDEILKLFRDDTLLVSLMHANNETGCLQPVAEVATLCHARGVLLHTDAAQSVGKIPVAVDQLQVDLLSLAGHKMYAPKGVGVLYVRHGVELEPLLHGAGHETGLRSGTENVPFVVALGKAADLAAKSDHEHTVRMSELRDRLLHRLRTQLGEELTVNGEAVERLPNTLSLNFPRVEGHQLLARTPEICASTGAACHSGDLALSATLRAMGLTPEIARGTVRLSIGWLTSTQEIDLAADSLSEAWHGLVD